MVIQLFGMGRAANPVALEKDGLGVIAAGPSAIKLAEYNDFPLRVLTEEEIVDYVHKFEQAARNAMAAGFDGVEIHGANGYLIDQFIQDTANQRTDRYGGSIENRSRFTLEIVDAVVAAIGAERTAIRFSPWSRYQEMRMTDPIPTFTYLIEQIKERHPSLMYLHMIEPNVFGGFSSEDSSTEYRASQGDSNDFAYKLWAPRPYITAGGYGNNLEAAVAAAEKGDASLVAFGKAFIANPDLPYRLRNSIPLHKYDRSSFYLIEDPKGYTDQPFASERTTKG
ncbi:FMN-linked oxidoreductase [Clavulina sp. PMI_390]|nr:FMN-linked oxidoreductase [Clavulina sp. PMI_390]